MHISSPTGIAVNWNQTGPPLMPFICSRVNADAKYTLYIYKKQSLQFPCWPALRSVFSFLTTSPKE